MAGMKKIISKFGQVLLASGVLSAFGMVECPAGRAEDVYTVVIKKQEEKRKRRWNLLDWLETKGKIELMDQWLALHSPSPFEFFVGGIYQVGTAPSAQGWGISAAAYASIVGLEAQYEKPGSGGAGSWLTLFDLRLFGYHNQGTQLTVEAGLRHSDWDGATVRNPVLGAKMSFYFNRFCGIEGLYRRFYESTPGPGGTLPAGERLEGGVFIDYRFLRIYGDYFGESTPGSRTGVNLGARFYF